MIEFTGHFHTLESARTCPDHCIAEPIIAAIEERAGWGLHRCRHDDRTCPAARCIRARLAHAGERGAVVVNGMEWTHDTEGRDLSPLSD